MLPLSPSACSWIHPCTIYSEHSRFQSQLEWAAAQVLTENQSGRGGAGRGGAARVPRYERMPIQEERGEILKESIKSGQERLSF